MTFAAPAFLGIGSPMVDLVSAVDDAFLERLSGEKGGRLAVSAEEMRQILSVLPGAPRMFPGGSAANTALAVARTGVPASVLGMIGNDAEGVLFRESLKRSGGSDRELIGVPGDTGKCLVLVTPDAERTMRANLGVSSRITAAEVTARDYSPYAIAEIEGYMFFAGIVGAAAEALRRDGVKTALDLASFEVVRQFRQELMQILPGIDILLANEEEAAELTGKNDPAAQLAAMGRMVPLAVLKRGAKGALIRTGDGAVIPIPAETVPAVDTTAAGDLWAAGFFSGLLRGWSPERAGRLGAHLSALVVQVPGSQLAPEVWSKLVQEIASGD